MPPILHNSDRYPLNKASPPKTLPTAEGAAVLLAAFPEDDPLRCVELAHSFVGRRLHGKVQSRLAYVCGALKV